MLQRLRLFLPLLIFAVVASVFFSLQARMAEGDYDPSALPSALVGEPFPPVSLPSLFEPGWSLSAEDLQSRPFLVNVWATWCAACRLEHGFLLELQDRGVAILGHNYKDQRDAALQWLKQLGDPYTAVMFDPDGDLGVELGVYGAPETFLVDAAGIIRLRHAGPLNERIWRDKFLPLLTARDS